MTFATPPEEGQFSGSSQSQGNRWLLSTVLLLASAVLLGFVVEVVLVSQVQFSRNQQILKSDFRSDLANAIAPVGPLDVNGVPVQPGSSVALISIRSLGLDAVVVEGTTSGQTMLGPGHKRDTPFPGQPGVSVIFGRQAAFGGPFGSLGDLIPGDPIVVTTGQGEQKFEVIDVRREGDPLPGPLSAGGSRLTLVTADGTPYVPSGVLRVDAELVSDVQPGPGVVVLPADLSPAEQAMEGDPGAWVGVVLWGQALLVAALVVTWLRVRWGRWQAWVVAVPVLGFLGLALGSQLVQLLPNLM